MDKIKMFGVVVSEKSATAWCWSTPSPELWELRPDGLYVWGLVPGVGKGNWLRVADCQTLAVSIAFSLGWDSCRQTGDDGYTVTCDNFRLLERGDK